MFARSRIQKNLTPYGQKNTTPIYNITSIAYDDSFTVYMKTNSTFLNSTPTSRINVTFSNTSSRIGETILNHSYQNICGNITTNGTSCGLWSYIDLGNYTGRYIIPYFFFTTICSNCTITNLTNFDDFYTIVR